MARLIFSQTALAELEKLTDFLIEVDPSAATETVGLIEEATSILKRHPLIGRQLDSDLRELIISRGKTGYVALYSYEADQDVALILAIRHQREAGHF
ncbi:plasmid stabilization system protein ParE [Oxalobacteraceae bacterium GrIS 2.11]